MVHLYSPEHKEDIKPTQGWVISWQTETGFSSLPDAQCLLMHVFFNYPRAHVLAETEEGWKDPIMGYGHVVITSLPFLQAARSWGAHTQASCVFKPLEPVSEPLLAV